MNFEREDLARVSNLARKAKAATNRPAIVEPMKNKELQETVGELADAVELLAKVVERILPK